MWLCRNVRCPHYVRDDAHPPPACPNYYDGEKTRCLVCREPAHWYVDTLEPISFAMGLAFVGATIGGALGDAMSAVIVGTACAVIGWLIALYHAR